GRARAVARRRGARARDGRADARRRRRRESGNLRADEPAHRRGRGHPDDLVRAAGSARHERSDLRHAPRTDSGGARCGGRHRRTGAPRGAWTRFVTWLRGAGRRFATVAGLIGLCLLLWILTPHFLTVANM